MTCGGTEAMMCAMMTICNPGDKVMVFSPFYENYGADAILSGADPIYIPLVPPDYTFDIRLVEEGFRMGAKAIIVCNPSNPCGKVFSREELTAIGRLAVQYDAFVVTDEVYEHMVYAPWHHTCMASLPGMFDHTITCNSLSKTYSITGWRLGYLIGPENVIEAAKKVHDFLTVGAAAPLQEAAVTGLSFPQSYYDGLLETYTEKRNYFLEGLDRIGLKHNVPQGTYFCADRYSGVSGSAPVRGNDRPAVLRMDDREHRRGGGARLQLFQGTGQPPDPSPFRERERNAG